MEGLKEAFTQEQIKAGLLSEQLKIRLDFMMYLFSSSFSVSIPDLQTLWTTFILGNFGESEKDVVFEFIEKLSSADGVPMDLIQMVFLTLLPSLEFPSFGKSAFRCFKKYFILINQKNGRLNYQQQIIELDLAGLDILWSIVLNAQDPLVFTEASDWLIHLHTQVTKPANSIFCFSPF